MECCHPRLIHAQAPATALAACRALVFGLWAVKLLLDPLEQLAELPASAFGPPAPLRYLPEGLRALWLDHGFLLALRWGTAGLLLLAASGRCLLVAGPLCCVLLTGYQSTLRGFGNINHSEIVPLLAVYALTVFVWADHLEGTSRPAVPLVAVTTILCLSYFLTGAYRLMQAGLDAFLTNTMEQSAIWVCLLPGYFQFDYGLYLLDYPQLGVPLRAGFAVVTLIELLAPFCLLFRAARIIFLAVMIPFHIMALLVMNIGFFENMVLLSLLMVDTSRWAGTTNMAPADSGAELNPVQEERS